MQNSEHVIRCSSVHAFRYFKDKTVCLLRELFRVVRFEDDHDVVENDKVSWGISISGYTMKSKL